MAFVKRSIYFFTHQRSSELQQVSTSEIGLTMLKSLHTGVKFLSNSNLCWKHVMRSMSSARDVLSQWKGGSVDLEKDEDTGIASIILNNPDKKNALSGRMMVDLQDVVSELESWQSGRGVMLYGKGDSFCSGGDLDFMRNLLADKQYPVMMCDFMQKTLQRLHNLPLISVALVHGNALGGGSELITACDFRVVSERVSIGFVQSKLGLIPGWGGGTRLVRLVGKQIALELLTTAKILSWREAVEIGLGDTVIHDTDYKTFVTHGKEWLQKHLPKNAQVSHAVKSMVRDIQQESDIQRAYEKEKALFATVYGSPPHVEALTNVTKHK